ncbi:MAG TPA: peroxidase family protein, partial [Puia sp.]|nr:peroxidase family protein [Puia sp.]
VDAFWSPQLVPQHQIDPFLKGFAAHNQYETDTRINSVLRNFLFGDPNKPTRFGVDLASLNIQRGRDHGLPDYNTVRKFYTGIPAKDFSDITSDPQLADSLKKLYGSVDNIDLWIGSLAEDRLPGKSIGKTMFMILKTQFEHLRDGDFYFYLNDPYLPSFTLNRLKFTKLSDVIKRNSSITNIQSDVFFMSACAEDTVDNGQFVDTTGANKFPQLFPNPATTIVTLDMGPATKLTANFSSLVKIFSTSGMQMKSLVVPAGQEFTQIDISRLSAGTYIVDVITGGKVSILKLVKLGG